MVSLWGSTGSGWLSCHEDPLLFQRARRFWLRRTSSASNMGIYVFPVIASLIAPDSLLRFIISSAIRGLDSLMSTGYWERWRKLAGTKILVPEGQKETSAWNRLSQTGFAVTMKLCCDNEALPKSLQILGNSATYIPNWGYLKWELTWAAPCIFLIASPILRAVLVLMPELTGTKQ